jgi:catechol 2,3-dioxygenase-like lactoylglutathione lyase family enzyme
LEEAVDIKLGHLELFVKNPERSRVFYEEVLDFTVTAVQADGLVWLKLGDLEVLLRQGEPRPSAEGYLSAGSAIVLYSSNLPATLDSLNHHEVDLYPMPGEENCYTFTDLDGHWFQVVDPNDFK